MSDSLSNLKPEQLVSLQPNKAVFARAVAEAKAPVAARSYRVKRGDNLGAIAKANRVSVKDIKRWNRLSGNNVRAGQVPGPARWQRAERCWQSGSRLRAALHAVQGTQRRFAVPGGQALQRGNETPQALEPAQRPCPEARPDPDRLPLALIRSPGSLRGPVGAALCRERGAKRPQDFSFAA